MWKIEDYTAKKGAAKVGYLRLTLDGKRVCDFFPYVTGSDPDWVIEMAHKLCEYANKSAKVRETA